MEESTNDVQKAELEQLARHAARDARRAKRVAQALSQVSGAHPVMARTVSASSSEISAPASRRARQSKKQRRAARSKKAGEV